MENHNFSWVNQLLVAIFYSFLVFIPVPMNGTSPSMLRVEITSGPPRSCQVRPGGSRVPTDRMI